MTNESIFNKDDFVYLKNGDNVESAGFKINSLLMKQNIPAMNTINAPTQSGGSVSSALNDLAVPAGLLLLQQKTFKHYKGDNMDNEVVNEDLFDKLLKMAGPNKNKKLTKRRKPKKVVKKTKRR